MADLFSQSHSGWLWTVELMEGWGWITSDHIYGRHFKISNYTYKPTFWRHARLFLCDLQEEITILVFHNFQECNKSRLAFCADDVNQASCRRVLKNTKTHHTGLFPVGYVVLKIMWFWFTKYVNWTEIKHVWCKMTVNMQHTVIKWSGKVLRKKQQWWQKW